MVSRYSFLVIFLLFSFLPHCLSAQSGEMAIRHFTMKVGLAHNQLFSLLQDSQGFIWVGSYAGLSKFDGYQFTTYQNNPADSNSLSDNIITYLWEDRQQRIWVGMFTGLNIFDPRTEKFHQLEFDSQGSEKGLAIDDGVQVSKIQERRDGKVWLCTAQGLYIADPKTLTIREFTFPRDNESESAPENVLNERFSDIMEAPDGSFWLASKQGLVHWDATNSQITRFQHNPEDPHSLSSDKVMTVHLDRSGQLLVGTYAGFDLFNPLDSSFTHIIIDRLPTDNAFWQKHALIEKPDGTLWIGFGDGLYAFESKTKQLDQILNQDTRTIIEDQQGNTWVATPQGLFQILPEKRKFTIDREIVRSKNSLIASVLTLVNNQSYSGPDILGIIPTSTGGWRASDFKLEKYDSQNQSFSSYPLPFSPLTLYRDSPGKIWLGSTVEFGIFDPQTEVYERLTDFTNIKVNDFLEDHNGNMWIGTSKGLIRYDLDKETAQVFKHNPDDSQSLSDNRIRDLLMDQSGSIWVGTLRGLNKMMAGTEKNTPKFDNWRSTNSDLPHDYIAGIVEDNDTTLWIGCGNQITHFYPQTGEFRNYNYQDGLSGQTIHKGLRSQQGEIYFLNGEIEDGLIVFHPDSLQDNSYIPPVEITYFSINNEPVLPGSFSDTLAGETSFTQSIFFTEELKLTFQQNDFSLEFAALNYVNPENNQYKYRLEPYEREWVEASSSNRVARYTNLSPGKYTFRVIGSNNDGFWNKEGASLRITILPPWWQTWWAYTLYGLLAVGAIVTLRHYEMKRFRLQQQAIHLAELDHLKSRFFANISHEFRTPLTLILGPLEKFIQQSEDSSHRSTYRLMQRNAQRLLRLVNQLLDLSKLESGNMKLDSKPQAIVPFLKSLALSFASLAERRQITYHFQFPSGNPVVYYDADKLEKIVSNLLSNAFKFTPDGGSVTVGITLQDGAYKKGQRILELKVQDSGPGIPEELIERIFDRFYQGESVLADEQQGSGIGLSLVRELVELHQGTISVKNTDRGACFTVTLPVNVADYEEISLSEANVPPSPSSYEPETDEALVEQYNQPEQNQSKPLVLVVEDNADVRTFIRDNLQADYQVQEAADGLAGLEKAKAEIPDLILSDVMMPKLDGVELCAKLKADEKTAHIPVILLTAKASGGDKIEGLETGADDYIIKPFKADVLRARIKNLIESRRMLRVRFSQEITLQPTSLSITSVDQQFLKRAMQIVEDHLSDTSFGVEAFSQEIGMSRGQLFRKLKALTDQSPGDLIRRLRLQRAAELLGKGAGNITDVTYLTGFSDPSYFTKCFQKEYGLTPSEYLASAVTE